MASMTETRRNRSLGARERARAEITAAIKEEASRQLAERGAAQLSLRAVARELGMVSSALYRYFPSRDDLLTALITDAYDALGAAAEDALADSRRRTASPPARWLAVCRAVRGWALAHPHAYALVYGSPVPGYEAPQSTTGPASRAALALVAVVAEAHATGTLQPDPGGPHRETGAESALPAELERDAAALAARLGLDLPPAATNALVAAWAQLFGLISFELFGQFTRVVEARDDFFDHSARALGAAVGL
jgi:AcrR family transcriptional regulator